MSELNPEELLAQLDEDQARAAMALRGPVAIIAGPGSGKTRTVSHRIAYGVRLGVFSPSRVLALSYTNRAAAELRVRLRELGVSSVQVRTFHSAALSQLQYFWPQVTGYSAPKLLTSKWASIAEVATELKLKLSEGQLAQVVTEIEYLGYAMKDPEDFSSTALEQERFVSLARGYRTLKQQRRQIDWEDAILLCTGMLRNEPRLMSQFEQQYRHFTVDEYQDISPLQQGLLETWLGEREDLCVVGDPRQTIYSFAGASSEFLLGFESRFDSAVVVELNRNYRSGKDIVKAANRVISDRPLVATKTTSGAVHLVPHESAAAEASWVVQQIRTSKLARAEVAILARTNSQLEVFEKQLADHQIAYQVRGQGRFFAKPEIRQALMAIRALSVTDGKAAVFEKVSEVLRSLGWSAAPGQQASNPLDWFLTVLEELGNPSLEEYLRELDERERSGHEPSADAITLATVHGTKGLEWEQVYLVGINEGVFPISHAKTEAELQEERRLFYVGITRARQLASVNYLAGSESEFVRELTDSRTAAN